MKGSRQPPDFAALHDYCRWATYVDRRSVGYQFRFSEVFGSAVWIDLNRAVVRKTHIDFQHMDIHATEIGWLKRLGASGIAPRFIDSRDGIMAPALSFRARMSNSILARPIWEKPVIGSMSL